MKKQPMYTFLLVFTVICVLAAISTLIPQASVEKVSLLGYKAHCPFTPVSTVICLLLAGTGCRIRAKKFKSVSPPIPK
ncbi:MAG: hypothetical protein JXX14_10960 [Deltaproteobacteria bacterium]|nr:hypothetical protein [Deltaproteobacteria bacterium]